MSLLGRIGVYFAFCLAACVTPFCLAHAGENPTRADCTISTAHLTNSYGAQLYTVRAAMAQDFEGTLCRVAQIGYREVEFAGLFDRDPLDIRTILIGYNLDAVASHADWRQLRDDPQMAIRDAKSLGARYLVLAWLPPEERQTLAQWRWWAGHLNKIGAISGQKGITLLYHAHDFEYEAIEGVRPIDLLQEQLDPKLVNFEMDIYWTVKGGGDPVTLLRRFPGRYPLVHVKDMQHDYTGIADIGDGRIDFSSIFAAAGSRDFLHKFVERDDAIAPFETLRRSLQHLKSIEREPTK